MRLIIECKGVRREYELSEGTTIVGRDPASCDIVFPEPSLSRRHLECTLRGGELLVRDLDTKNGTFLGPQRIEEARLPAGVSLRAGNVRIRFEADQPRPAITIEPTPSAAARSEPQPPEPPSQAIEEDDEPTPADEEASQAAAADLAAGGIRLVVRDNRWFVQDPATGAEVEIVPRGRPTPSAAEQAARESPTAAPQPIPPVALARRAEPLVGVPRTATLPPEEPAAQPVARRRRLILIGVAGLLVAILAVTAALLLRPQKETQLMPLSQYREEAAQAAALFEKGDREEAAEKLRRLQWTPTHGRPRLAEILLAAFEADSRAMVNFAENWESAQERWEEVRKSSESPESVVELAKNRLAWLQAETLNMVRLNDARQCVKQGNYLKALQQASAVSPDSFFRKDAEPIIRQAVDAVVQRAHAEAEQRRWAEAIRHAQSVLKASPEIAASLEPKIKLWQQNESQRLILEQATTLAGEGRQEEALRLLSQVAPSSPYASEAAALQKECLQKGAIQLANAAYQAGEGEKAIEILTRAGMADSPLASKIQAVMKAKAHATEEIRNSRFTEAKNALEQILQLESAQTNAYAQYAKRTLDGMPQLIRNTAFLLVDEAKNAALNREFRTARTKFEEALRLDPTNVDAREGLKELARSAVVDYNKALAVAREDIDQALQLQMEVRDRLPPTHELYPKVETEIYHLTQLKARREKEKQP